MLGLPALIGMIVVGISVGVLAVHLAGGSERPQLADDGEARSIFLVDFPESRIGPIVYTHDRRTAFFELAMHRTGIVHGIGNKFLTRCISASDVASAEPAGDRALKVRWHDITWPRQTFSFASETDRSIVRAWLQASANSAEGITHERAHVL
ncbi:hypothetical protein EV217_0027 [Phyllobacterium myrsinacearum]|uniref:hypothetical protein n=1 Tax=Phyllobacterium myrsinacearum TaxID=28101 RepID=UPI0010292D26|nr:hypothetical protein [Phyllobacterium myrsinacearum]RZS87652.1 hypothetical protein EV217_0027 [Phyllobacterium myrsinacearum]